MARNLFANITAMLAVGHKSPGFPWMEMRAQVKPASVSVGNQKIAARYATPNRLRIAHLITALLAFATLFASMVSGQRTMLDILSIIFFAAAIILKLGMIRAPAKKPARKPLKVRLS